MIIENHTGVAVGDYAKLTLPNGSTRYAQITAMHDDNSFNYTGLPTGAGDERERLRRGHGGPNWQIEKLPVRSTDNNGDEEATTPESLIYVLSAVDEEARQFVGKVVRTANHTRSMFVRVPYENNDFGAAIETWVILEQGVSAGEALGDALVANAEAQAAEVNLLDGSAVRPSEETGIITDLQQQVTRLTGERDNLAHALTRANERFEQRDGEFRLTVDVIGGRLLQEREGRSWCSEFNDIVNEVNEELPVYKLPLPTEEFDFDIDVEGTMRATVSVRVSGTSRDEAEQEAFNMNASEIDSNLTQRGLDSIDSVLTSRASRRSFDNVQLCD